MHCSKGFGCIAILISTKIELVLDSILCVIEVSLWNKLHLHPFDFYEIICLFQDELV